MTDPLAMLFAEKYGFKWDQCSVMAETVRAFLAERVTRDAVIRELWDSVSGPSAMPCDPKMSGSMADAVLALLQRKMGGA